MFEALHPELVHAFTTASYHLQITNLFVTASYALYCYDHLLVFSDEVDRIWKQPFHLPSLLYVLHRYLSHIVFIVMHVLLHEREWSAGICERLVRLPYAIIVIIFTLTAAILTLRMYSMFWKNRILLICLSIVVVGQTVIMAVCLSTGVRLPLTPGCILTSAASYFVILIIIHTNLIFEGAFWAAPLATDAALLALALYRLYDYREFRIRSTLGEQVLRDGALYVVAVFCVKLVNVVAFYTAPDDLRELGGAFTIAVTSLLVARLQLSLATGDRAPRARDGVDAHHLFFDPTLAHEVDSSYCQGLRRFFTLGNLGAQINVKGPDTALEADAEASLESLEGGVRHKYHYRRRTVTVAPVFDFDPLPPSLGVVNSPRSAEF